MFLFHVVRAGLFNVAVYQNEFDWTYHLLIERRLFHNIIILNFIFRLLLGWFFCTQYTMTMNTYQTKRKFDMWIYTCVFWVFFCFCFFFGREWKSRTMAKRMWLWIKTKSFVRLMMCQFPDANLILINMNFFFPKKQNFEKIEYFCVSNFAGYSRKYHHFRKSTHFDIYVYVCVCAFEGRQFGILSHFSAYEMLGILVSSKRA